MLTTLLLALAMASLGQAPNPQQPPSTQKPTTPPGGAGKAPPGAAGQDPPGALQPQPAAAAQVGPVSITLNDALQRARDYSQQYLAANIAVSLAREDRVQARAAQLPSLNYFNQNIYTEGNGTPTGVFVANDGVHIYNNQAVVHEELFSFTHRAEYRRAIAAEAVARARAEIAI